MRIVEAYRAGRVVELHRIDELLTEAGIEFHIAGDDAGTIYGGMNYWAAPRIMVAEEDLARARECIDQGLGHQSEIPREPIELRFGLQVLMVNFTIVAMTLGLYRPLGPFWPTFAYIAFLLLAAGNLAYFALPKTKKEEV